jgi:hypothetical protein
MTTVTPFAVGTYNRTSEQKKACHTEMSRAGAVLRTHAISLKVRADNVLYMEHSVSYIYGMLLTRAITEFTLCGELVSLAYRKRTRMLEHHQVE